MSFTSTSTASLVSNTSVSSRTPLTRTAQQKDYQAAFGNLQSTYGFGGSGLYYGVGGSALSPLPKQNKSTSSKKPKSSPTASATETPRSSLKPTKNFQAAFADLQSNIRLWRRLSLALFQSSPRSSESGESAQSSAFDALTDLVLQSP